MAVAQTTPVTAPSFSVAAAAETEQAGPVLRKWTISVGGMYTVRVPANTGIQLRLNGDLLVDATGTRIEDVGELITAFISLQPGDHAVEITGVSEENRNIQSITVNEAGQAPQPLFALTVAMNEEEAETILAARAGLNVPMGSSTAPSGTAVASGSPFTPFSIGGGSSGTARAAASAAAAGGGLQMASADAGLMNSQTDRMRQQAAMGGSGVSSMGGSGGSTAGSGQSVSSPGMSGGGGVSVPSVPSVTGNPGTPGTPGTPTPTPTTGTPPTVVPSPSVTPEPSVGPIVSPLTPPANVPLTQMIQLVSAGNAEGQVANTGATLFGAVQADSVFDQIDVTFEPAVRDTPTTVSVGPESGQFAVRLFEEDFANTSNLTVTLVGRLSSNEEVVSQPVSYTVTGVPVADGVGQALSRLTFGPTPELYARLRAIGFNAYVQEQLNPASINDSAFQSMQPDDLLDWTTNNTNDMFRSLLAHDTAHAAFSERQLQEVMSRFWSNHFHAITKGTQIKQQNITDRIFFRENALGNFEDMLLYSARSPLMSQYLDNDNNRVDGNRGLNENYAREILELSTVGVDAGYGPDDIIAVARVFTGWAYRQTNEGVENDVAREYEFAFFPERHDQGDKTIPFLATTIAGQAGEAGVLEGEQLISILAQHSSTRTHVCGKIVQLLVADQPPADLVSACAAAWEASGGEVVPMLEAILLDPSYITSVEYQRTKVKNPFEFAVSTIRAFGARPQAGEEGDFYRRFREVFEDAGYVPLFFGAPTGMPEVGAAWTSSAKLAASYERMNHIAERRENYGIDLLADVLEAGLETPEEVASYLLTVATADRFTQQEFDKVVEVLKGDDMIFEPMGADADERRALEKAMGLIFVTPSFLLQ